MLKQLFLKKYPLLFFISVILMASCNNGESEKSNTGKQPADIGNSISSAIPVITQPVMLAPSGLLDTLWVDSLTFVKLPKGKLVFSFTFGKLDTLTLNGWNANGILQDSYNTNPDLYLIKGQASTEHFGAGTYFGNVILYRNDVADIKDLLKKKHAKYVLFAPKKLGEHISYDIFLSNDNPTGLIKMFTTTATGKTLNPSPPKTY